MSPCGASLPVAHLSPAGLQRPRSGQTDRGRLPHCRGSCLCVGLSGRRPDRQRSCRGARVRWIRHSTSSTAIRRMCPLNPGIPAPRRRSCLSASESPPIAWSRCSGGPSRSSLAVMTRATISHVMTTWSTTHVAALAMTARSPRRSSLRSPHLPGVRRRGGCDLTPATVLALGCIDPRAAVALHREPAGAAQPGDQRPDQLGPPDSGRAPGITRRTGAG